MKLRFAIRGFKMAQKAGLRLDFCTVVVSEGPFLDRHPKKTNFSRYNHTVGGCDEG